jgi:23S rRNA pseudouridine1911/1915/1917 synthase
LTKTLSNTKNLQILYEDNHIIAINKRCGDIVQGDKTGDKPLSEIVKSYLKEKYNKPGNVFLGVVHRIDRPTSGVVMFAKTSKSLSRLNNMFKNGKIEKYYLAIIKNTPKKNEDTLIHWLLKKLDRYNLIEIKLETGRHHQIRCQLHAIDCPIRGDLKYGYDRSNVDGGIDLHAKTIIFEHPVTKNIIKINAPVKKNKIWSATQ